ncbi:MAG: hypothetical protein P8X89_22800 [Reinekea sp.]
MKSSIIIFNILILVACNSATDLPESSLYPVKIGEENFEIPSQYLLSGLPSAMVPTEGLDNDSNGVSIRLSLGDIGLSSKGELQDKLLKNVVIHIASLDSSSTLNQAALDAWNGKNSYRNGVIEFDKEVGLYRVYTRAGYPAFWQYFRTSPEDGGNAFTSWVADCYLPPQIDEKHIQRSTCHLRTQYKTTESIIAISGEIMTMRDSIIEKYTQQLSSWEMN